MARISEKVIDTLKQTIDLVAVIKDRGVTLRKRGKQYKGHCPFHPDEKTPSFAVTPAENLWHCFGCDAGGDVIRFVELMDKVSFPEAVKRLNGHQGISHKGSFPLTIKGVDKSDKRGPIKGVRPNASKLSTNPLIMLL